MENLSIETTDGLDVVRFQPVGVCSKLMQIKIQNNIIKDIEIIGGCSGNLAGISNLVRGMNIEEVVKKLQGIPCGSKATSCPDQLAAGLASYIKNKQTVNA